MKVLITTANGMFGGATLEALRARGVAVRALVRHPEKLPETGPGIEVFQGDLDDPASVAEAVSGVQKVFLVTPMDDRIADRELGVIAAARKAGVRHVVKIFGAVNHEGDPLISMHLRAIAALEESGLEWTLISPNSVMETSLLPLGEGIRREGAIFGISAHGKVGFVALADVAQAAATALAEEGHSGQNYELTGPAALDLYEVAAIFSEVLGREIRYVDLPDAEFARLLTEYGGFSPEAAELQVLCHLRLWRKGNAEKVTDTFERLTGRKPTPLADWVQAHASAFR